MQRILFFGLVLLLPKWGAAQSPYTVSGYVTDAQTGEALIGVTVLDTLSKQGAVTNGYGFYSLTLAAKPSQLQYSYIGYQTMWITLGSEGTQDVALQPQSRLLDQVVIEADTEDAVEVLTFDRQDLTMEEVRKLPLFMGEPDLIKAVQLQPGIKTLGDGTSGMFVRGGSADQNLILIDEAPIYNASHMFGLVSVFNPIAVNSVQLYKSNVPARYGGRVAAVLDTKMKEGNRYQHQLDVSLSPLVSSLTVNGPLKTGAASYFVSARKSLVDLFFQPNGNVLEIVPGFYDFNAKVNVPLSGQDRLFVSYYQGKDQLRTREGFTNDWGNRISSVRWNRQWNNRLFTNVSVIYSDYDNEILLQDSVRNYTWHTGVVDVHPKLDLYYYVNARHTLEAGIGTQVHYFTPGQSDDPTNSLPNIQALEHAMYLQHDAQWGEKLGMQYGLRFSLFQNYGAYRGFTFGPQGQLLDTITHTGGIYHTQWALEPRVNLRYHPHPAHAIKLSYARNAQYLQVLQNNVLAYTSLETWFPTTPNVQPILSDGVAGSWEFTPAKGLLRVTGYYKWLNQVLDYIDHAQLIGNPAIEGELRAGTGRAYGIELEGEYTWGPVDWQASYTYSRALRTVSGINGGATYRAPFDIPHDARLTALFAINDRWEASANFALMSGRPVTLPVGFFIDGDDMEPVPIYTERNGAQMPLYHRLDVGVQYTTPPQGDRGGYWTYSLSVYNLYGRRNPIGYAFRFESDEIVPTQFILFRALPSFSIRYHLSFK